MANAKTAATLPLILSSILPPLAAPGSELPPIGGLAAVAELADASPTARLIGAGSVNEMQAVPEVVVAAGDDLPGREVILPVPSPLTSRRPDGPKPRPERSPTLDRALGPVSEDTLDKPDTAIETSASVLLVAGPPAVAAVPAMVEGRFLFDETVDQPVHSGEDTSEPPRLVDVCGSTPTWEAAHAEIDARSAPPVQAGVTAIAWTAPVASSPNDRQPDQGGDLQRGGVSMPVAGAAPAAPGAGSATAMVPGNNVGRAVAAPTPSSASLIGATVSGVRRSDLNGPVTSAIVAADVSVSQGPASTTIEPALLTPGETQVVDKPQRSAETMTSAPSASAPNGIMPAFRAFAGAMFKAARPDAQATMELSRTTGPAPVLGMAAPTSLATTNPAAPIDLTQPRWPVAMAERIEMLRDRVDAGDTRIRLVPDALGSIDVAVRQVGDTVHVHFTAAEAQTRAILIEAHSQLARAAADRGMTLGEASVGGGGPSDTPQRMPQPMPTTPRRARTAVDDPTDPDTRIA